MESEGSMEPSSLMWYLIGIQGQGPGSRVQITGSRVQGPRCRVNPVIHYQVRGSGFGLRVECSGFSGYPAFQGLTNKAGFCIYPGAPHGRGVGYPALPCAWTI